MVGVSDMPEMALGEGMTKYILMGGLLLAQAAPPPDVMALNRMQHAYTLLQSEAVDAAAAELITAPALSLVTDWYQRSSVVLYLDGPTTQQIDTTLGDLMNSLSDHDRAYFQPYAALIVALRKQNESQVQGAAKR